MLNEIQDSINGEYCWNGRGWHLYSGDLNSNPLKYGNLWNPGFLRGSFQMVQFSNVFWQNGRRLSSVQMARLTDFRSHSKSGPFATQPLFDHLKSRLVLISDAHCIILHWKKVSSAYQVYFHYFDHNRVIEWQIQQTFCKCKILEKINGTDNNKSIFWTYFFGCQN